MMREYVLLGPREVVVQKECYGAAFELWSQLLKGGYLGDHIGDYYRGY